jgi:hypothetical protein
MYTMEQRARFIALAGPGYEWAGVKGCSRPASDVRKALRDDLAARQGGICPQCGDALRGNYEFCHLVARGPKVKGFVEGNIFAGHPACNASTKPLYDNEGNLLPGGIEALEPSDLARPDLVPTEWTPFPILRAR